MVQHLCRRRRRTDIATYKPNRSRGRFNQNSFCLPFKCLLADEAQIMMIGQLVVTADLLPWVGKGSTAS